MLQKLEVIIFEVCYTGILEHTDKDMHTCSHMQDTHTNNVHACMSACTYLMHAKLHVPRDAYVIE